MPSQLSLALSLRDDATFKNFLAPPGSVRAEAIQMLQGRLPQPETLCYLWGAQACGISHCLQAVCHYYLETGQSTQYLPISEVLSLDPADLLSGLEYQSVICLEDIELIRGMAEWERALFNLYNKVRDLGNLLVVSADRPPRELQLSLADLQSRLSSGVVYHFSPYSEEEKLAIFRFRAARLGFDIPEEVALFLFTRGDRNLDELLGYIKQLDTASLRAQRRVTIPFVKQVFGW